MKCLVQDQTCLNCLRRSVSFTYGSKHSPQNFINDNQDLQPHYIYRNVSQIVYVYQNYYEYPSENEAKLIPNPSCHIIELQDRSCSANLICKKSCMRKISTFETSGDDLSDFQKKRQHGPCEPIKIKSNTENSILWFKNPLENAPYDMKVYQHGNKKSNSVAPCKCGSQSKAKSKDTETKKRNKEKGRNRKRDITTSETDLEKITQGKRSKSNKDQRRNRSIYIETSETDLEETTESKKNKGKSTKRKKDPEKNEKDDKKQPHKEDKKQQEKDKKKSKSKNENLEKLKTAEVEKLIDKKINENVKEIVQSMFEDMMKNRENVAMFNEKQSPMFSKRNASEAKDEERAGAKRNSQDTNKNPNAPGNFPRTRKDEQSKLKPGDAQNYFQRQKNQMVNLAHTHDHFLNHLFKETDMNQKTKNTKLNTERRRFKTDTETNQTQNTSSERSSSNIESSDVNKSTYKNMWRPKTNVFSAVDLTSGEIFLEPPSEVEKKTPSVTETGTEDSNTPEKAKEDMKTIEQETNGDCAKKRTSLNGKTDVSKTKSSQTIEPYPTTKIICTKNQIDESVPEKDNTIKSSQTSDLYVVSKIAGTKTKQIHENRPQDSHYPTKTTCKKSRQIDKNVTEKENDITTLERMNSDIISIVISKKRKPRDENTPDILTSSKSKDTSKFLNKEEKINDKENERKTKNTNERSSFENGCKCLGIAENASSVLLLDYKPCRSSSNDVIWENNKKEQKPKNQNSCRCPKVINNSHSKPWGDTTDDYPKSRTHLREHQPKKPDMTQHDPKRCGYLKIIDSDLYNNCSTCETNNESVHEKPVAKRSSKFSEFINNFTSKYLRGKKNNTKKYTPIKHRKSRKEEMCPIERLKDCECTPERIFLSQSDVCKINDKLFAKKSRKEHRIPKTCRVLEDVQMSMSFIENFCHGRNDLHKSRRKSAKGKPRCKCIKIETLSDLGRPRKKTKNHHDRKCHKRKLERKIEHLSENKGTKLSSKKKRENNITSSSETINNENKSSSDVDVSCEELDDKAKKKRRPEKDFEDDEEKLKKKLEKYTKLLQDKEEKLHHHKTRTEAAKNKTQHLPDFEGYYASIEQNRKVSTEAETRQRKSANESKKKRKHSTDEKPLGYFLDEEKEKTSLSPKTSPNLYNENLETQNNINTLQSSMGRNTPGDELTANSTYRTLDERNRRHFEKKNAIGCSNRNTASARKNGSSRYKKNEISASQVADGKNIRSQQYQDCSNSARTKADVAEMQNKENLKRDSYSESDMLIEPKPNGNSQHMIMSRSLTLKNIPSNNEEVKVQFRSKTPKSYVNPIQPGHKKAHTYHPHIPTHRHILKHSHHTYSHISKPGKTHSCVKESKNVNKTVSFDQSPNCFFLTKLQKGS